MSALSDLVNGGLSARGWGGKSLRDLEAATDGKLGKDSIAKYRNGTHGRPDERTVAALAELVNLPVTVIRAAAGVPYGDLEAYEAPPEASRLSRRQRLALDELIRSIVVSEGEHGASQEPGSEEAGPQHGGEKSEAPIDGPETPLERAAQARVDAILSGKRVKPKPDRGNSRRASGDS